MNVFIGAAQKRPTRPLYGRTLIWGSVIVLVALLLLGAPSLIYPFGKDQGEYAYIASAFLKNKVIYKDVFNVKPPLTHWLHVVALQLFGHAMMAIRLFDWLWQGAAAVVIFLITALLYQRRWLALWAAVLYGVTYFATDFWHSAQTDGFITLPVALSLLLFLVALRQDSYGLWLGSGFLLGTAVLLKYPMGIILPLLLLNLLLIKKPGRAFYGNGLTILIGFSLPLLFFLASLMFQGALADFLSIQFGYIPQYNAGFITDKSYLAYTWNLFLYFEETDARIKWFMAVLLAEILLSGTVAEWPHEQWIIPFWGIAALVHLIVQNKYYHYHMLPLLAPQAMMVVHLAANLRQAAVRFMPRLQPMVATAVIVTPMLIITQVKSPYQHKNIVTRYQTLWSIASGDTDLKQYYQRDDFGAYGWGVFSSRANLEVAAYLQQHTTVDEKVFIWAFEPGIYFLAERESASRFIYNFPLYGDFAWPEFRESLIHELEKNKPAIIMVAQNDAQPWLTGTTEDSMAAFQTFTALSDFVQREYEATTVIAQFTIFERKT
jgi:hypothetical protein